MATLNKINTIPTAINAIDKILVKPNPDSGILLIVLTEVEEPDVVKSDKSVLEEVVSLVSLDVSVLVTFSSGEERIFDMTYECGSFATYLSGSGPTIVSIIDGNDHGFKGSVEKLFSDSEHRWRGIMLECDNVGSVVSVTD